MPSQFSPNKGYEEQATGENNGTWGIKLNAVLATIDLNFGGRYAATGLTGGTVNVTSGEAENVRHTLSGTLTSNLIYNFPNAGSFYIVTNNTTGPHTVSLGNAGGGGTISLPQGTTALVFVNPDIPGVEVVVQPVLITPTTLNGDTAGTATCSQPAANSYYKKVVIFLAGYQQAGAGQTYTFPTAFTQTPVPTANSDPPAPRATISTTQIVLPGSMAAPTSGIIILEGI